MELKKYLKNYWSKILIFIMIIIGSIFICLYEKYHHTKKEIKIPHVMLSTSPRIISTNIKWNDSICNIILDEIELVSVVNEEKYKTKNSHEGFITLSDKDTLILDSLSYMLLKKYYVTPQYSIDSIYRRKGIKGLYSTFSNNEWFTPYYSNDSILTLPEQRYVIYILQQHGLSFKLDCESGHIYIIKP